MKEHLEKIKSHIERKYPKWKFLIGVILIIIGLIALVTPLTPGSWLAIIGLELVGISIITKNKKGL